MGTARPGQLQSRDLAAELGAMPRALEALQLVQWAPLELVQERAVPWSGSSTVGSREWGSCPCSWG